MEKEEMCVLLDTARNQILVLEKGQWVFFGVECGSNKSFYFPAEKRDAVTLLAVLKEYVEPNTIIMSHCWKAYQSLHMNHLLQLSRVSVVLGNETCDLDSAISSLVYGLLLHHLNTPDSVVVPVFNIPRMQLPVKTEVTYFLRKYGINLNSIICRDEIDLEVLKAKGSLQLTLVDHHVVHPSDNQLISSVVAVIDHRPHDPAWPWPQVNLNLQTVGSCCTLIAEKILTQAPELVTPSVATFLLGTILLDTACLSSAAGRATPLDHQMADRLQNLCGPSVDRRQLFKELQTAKSDISLLTSGQLLIKDLKIAAGIPIVGLPMKVKEFLLRSDASLAVQKFCEEQKVEVCVVYGMAVEGETVTRNLAVFTFTNTEAATKIVAALTECQNPSLDLQPQPCSVKGFRLFEQLNIKATRKQVLPIIRQIGETLHGR